MANSNQKKTDKKLKKEYKEIRKDWDVLKSGQYNVFKKRYNKDPNDSMVKGHDHYDLFKEHADIELRAGGGMIKKYSIGGDVRSNKTKKSNNTFIARGCGRVMNNRRKKTKIY